MLSFNFRAISTEGKPIADRIEAESVNAALALLRQRGYSQVQLLDDEKGDDESRPSLPGH